MSESANLVRLIMEHVPPSRLSGLVPLDFAADLGTGHDGDLLRAFPDLRLMILTPGGYREAHAIQRTYANAERRRIRTSGSQEAAESVPDGGLDFVLVPGNWPLESILGAVRTWGPKIAPEGAIFGELGYDDTNSGIKRFFGTAGVRFKGGFWVATKGR